MVYYKIWLVKIYIKILVSLGILRNKIGMTQVFLIKECDSVTIIKVDLVIITPSKSQENCGYNAIQIGYLEISAKFKFAETEIRALQ
jgi:ribosomal protein L3